MIWIYIFTGFLFFFLLIITASTIFHIFVSAPYVPSNKRILSEMLAIADLRPNAVVYDLGAGDGRILQAAKRICPDIHAKAVEIAPALYYYGRFRCWMAHQKIHWTLGSVYKQDLHDADVIFVYLFPNMLKKLEPKFNEQLRPGTQVISHAFVFPSKKPIKKLELQCGRIKRTIHVYEW